jgi:hypothetical protein
LDILPLISRGGGVSAILKIVSISWLTVTFEKRFSSFNGSNDFRHARILDPPKINVNRISEEVDKDNISDYSYNPYLWKRGFLCLIWNSLDHFLFIGIAGTQKSLVEFCNKHYPNSAKYLYIFKA